MQERRIIIDDEDGGMLQRDRPRRFSRGGPRRPCSDRRFFIIAF
jgi:hypothetical protein